MGHQQPMGSAGRFTPLRGVAQGPWCGSPRQLGWPPGSPNPRCTRLCLLPSSASSSAPSLALHAYRVPLRH